MFPTSATKTRSSVGDFDRSRNSQSTAPSNWVEGVRKEAELLRSYDSSNVRESYNTTTDSPSKVSGNKIPSHSTPVSTPCPKIQVKCRFGEKCRNKQNCKFIHNEQTKTKTETVIDRDGRIHFIHVEKCYCCGLTEHASDQCPMAEEQFGVARGTGYHQKHLNWVMKNNPKGYLCDGCGMTYHPPNSRCPAAPFMCFDSKETSQDRFVKETSQNPRNRPTKGTIMRAGKPVKPYNERSLAESNAYRKMSQKKTIRDPTPKPIRPNYTVTERPEGFVCDRTKNRMKSVRLYKLERAPYPDDIEYYKVPKERLRPRKAGPIVPRDYIQYQELPSVDQSLSVVVNDRLRRLGNPHRLPPFFGKVCPKKLKGLYTGKDKILNKQARELIQEYITRMRSNKDDVIVESRYSLRRSIEEESEIQTESSSRIKLIVFISRLF